MYCPAHMVKDMRRRYPEYQGGGMPSEMPTDIQRLIKRMLEARTDSAEEVIPDMAYGGIIGLQGGGPVPPDPRFKEFLELENQGRLTSRQLDRWRKLRGELDDLVDRSARSGSLSSVNMRDVVRGPSDVHVGHSGPGSNRSRLLNLFKPEGQVGSLGPVRPLGRALKAFGGLGLGLDLLMSPERAGAGEVPEEDLLSDEEKMRYYDELMGQGAGLMPSRDYFSRPSSEDAMTRGYPGRQLRRASGGIIGLQAGGSPYQQQMVQSYVSPEVAQPYANLTGRIQRAGAQPYTPYGGQRLAATTADQALARGAYGAYGRGAGPAGTQQAAATMGQAGQMLGGAYQGVAGLQPQYAQMAGQFGAQAQGALGQAQADAARLRGAAGTAQMRGDLAAAGMRGTGAAAQAEQQRLGVGQAAAGAAGQQQMAGLGAGMGAAGQAALAAQQQFGTGIQGLGAGAAGQAQAREAQAAALGQQAQQAGAAGQAQMAGLGTQAQQLGTQAMGQMGATGQQALGIGQQAMAQMGGLGGQAGQLGTDIRGQLGGTGLQAQQAGQIGAADIRQAGLEGQQLGQQALGQMGQVGQQSQQQAQQAAGRMREIGGQAPELQRGADLPVHQWCH